MRIKYPVRKEKTKNCCGNLDGLCLCRTRKRWKIVVYVSAPCRSMRGLMKRETGSNQFKPFKQRETGGSGDITIGIAIFPYFVLASCEIAYVITILNRRKQPSMFPLTLLLKGCNQCVQGSLLIAPSLPVPKVKVTLRCNESKQTILLFQCCAMRPRHGTE